MQRGGWISIHALRVEGDRRAHRQSLHPSHFYPRPPGGGRLIELQNLRRCQLDFYPRPPGGGRRTKEGQDVESFRISIHALRVEGDSKLRKTVYQHDVFLSTPSGWRATRIRSCRPNSHHISIHALRVEGDEEPRARRVRVPQFLSTPSGWRATLAPRSFLGQQLDFYPRPPGGGRRDWLSWVRFGSKFLSTPSGWRATVRRRKTVEAVKISIHALRVEGDTKEGQDVESFRISIHALRVEGDGRYSSGSCAIAHFYPRPPGGGRLDDLTQELWNKFISIHALRVEGDPIVG